MNHPVCKRFSCIVLVTAALFGSLIGYWSVPHIGLAWLPMNEWATVHRWEHRSLPDIPETPTEIIGVSWDINPSKKYIYVATKHGSIYEMRRTDRFWVQTEAPIDLPVQYDHLCQALPQTGRPVVDVTGWPPDNSMPDIERCYVLFEDGSLEIWSYEYDIFDVARAGTMYLIFAVAVVLLGAGAGVLTALMFLVFTAFVKNRSRLVFELAQ